MSAYVVDASVAAKWLFKEDGSEAAAGLLMEGNDLRAPDFLLVEANNIIWKKIQRREISEAEGRAVRAALRRMPVRMYDTPPLLDAAYEYAIRCGCSVYDGIYVALADFLGVGIVTADRKLCNILQMEPSINVLWVGDLA